MRQILKSVLRNDVGVTVMTNAVGLPGTAFGVLANGGCVFGSILTEISVEVGGYVNDGGCLAIQAH